MFVLRKHFLSRTYIASWHYRRCKQVVRLWQKDRVSSAILRGGVTSRLNFRLKGYVSRQYLWMARQNREMVGLPFAAGSFHTKKFCSRLYSTDVKFYLKNKKSLPGPPFEGLRGNVRTPSIARWKARGRLPIPHNWTFSLSLTVETLYEEICRSRRVSKGVGHFERKLQTEGGVTHQPLTEFTTANTALA